MGNYQVGLPGYGGVQAQPGAVYPGPPVAPQQGIQQFQVQPQMAPQGGAIQPMADPNMAQPVQQMGGMPTGGIQQVGYEEPQRQRFKPAGWLTGSRDAAQRNPALRATNATTPSLQNGNDGRLGVQNQAVQQQRQRQQMLNRALPRR